MQLSVSVDLLRAVLPTLGKEAGIKLAESIAEQAVSLESGPDAADGGDRLRAAFVSDELLQSVIAKAVTQDPAQALAVIQGRQDQFTWAGDQSTEETSRLSADESTQLKRKIVTYLRKHPGTGKSAILIGIDQVEMSKNVFGRLMRELLSDKEVRARGQRGKRRYWVKA